MSIVLRSCVALVCDVCADGWDDVDAEPHFANRAEAVAFAEAAGWVVTADRALCRGCTPVELCGIGGHHFGPWAQAGPFLTRGGGTWTGRVRHCRTCTSADWDPPVAERDALPHRDAG